MVFLAIADEFLGVGKEPGMSLAAVEQRQRMVARERLFGNVAPEELRAAHDQ